MGFLDISVQFIHASILSHAFDLQTIDLNVHVGAMRNYKRSSDAISERVEPCIVIEVCTGVMKKARIG